jgi:hypothetical protein
VVDFAVVVFGLLVALWLAEFLAGKYLESEHLVDDMASGLVAYDRDLGWHLTPKWEGEHRNSDFTLRYSIDARGFRAAEPRRVRDTSSVSSAGNETSITAVVGNSFTFGLGVPTEETFVALLDEQSGSSRRYRNFGIPGYSTHQQLIMLETGTLSSHVVVARGLHGQRPTRQRARLPAIGAVREATVRS